MKLVLSSVLTLGILLISITSLSEVYADNKIPSWVKNNAKWWNENSIGDDEFVKGIQYLIQQKIIKISDTQQGSQSLQNVPPWVKNMAGFWVDSKASDDDFIKAIEYLVQVGIIQIDFASTQTSIPTPTIPTTPLLQNTTVNPTIPLQQSPNPTSNNQAYTRSLLGAGINLKIVNNTASGTLNLNGKQYSAPNLLMIIKEDQIQLTGYIQGTSNVLLETTGFHTTGIEYKFLGSIMNNGKPESVAFTALFTNPSEVQPTTTTTQNTTSTTPLLPMLMLTSGYDQVYMQYPYNLVVKIFDPKINPEKNFDQFNGGISDVNITASILDQNNHLLIQLSGKTDNKGVYQDGITIPYSNYATQQMKVIIDAAKKGYITQSTTMFFTIFRYGGSASEVVNPPTGLIATYNGTSGDVDLKWTAPSSGTIKAYEIERWSCTPPLDPSCSNPTPLWSVLEANTGNTRTEYSDNDHGLGLDPNTTYTYRVSTVGISHNSQPSNTATVTTP